VHAPQARLSDKHYQGKSNKHMQRAKRLRKSCLQGFSFMCRSKIHILAYTMKSFYMHLYARTEESPSADCKRNLLFGPTLESSHHSESHPELSPTSQSCCISDMPTRMCVERSTCSLMICARGDQEHRMSAVM
jgi:hypothetical protein